MIDKETQSRLDRFLKSPISNSRFSEGRIKKDFDFYAMWDWMVTTKNGADNAAHKFGIDIKSIYRWIERTEHNIEDTKRDKMIDGVLHWQCTSCEEIKEVNSHNFTSQKKHPNKRGFRSKCKTCMNKYYKEKRKNEKTTTE